MCCRFALINYHFFANKNSSNISRRGDKEALGKFFLLVIMIGLTFHHDALKMKLNYSSTKHEHIRQLSNIAVTVGLLSWSLKQSVVAHDAPKHP